MTDDVLAEIWEPFKQADASTTRRFGGSGLGLAIVHRLVRAMDGSIDVWSRKGEGSRFTVRLPAVPCDPPASVSAAPEKGPARALSILLAEDNGINRKVATMLLRSLGHEVTAVENGALAVAAVEGAKFDLVLMDCFMPEMDGFEATRRIRSAGHEVPVVALTAASLAEEQKRCLECGMRAVLLKPIDPHQLRDVLARFA